MGVKVQVLTFESIYFFSEWKGVGCIQKSDLKYITSTFSMIHFNLFTTKELIDL